MAENDPSFEALERENRQLRRAVEELSLLNELATAIGGAGDLEGIMQTLIRRSLHAVDAEQGVITLVDEGAAEPMKTLVRTMVSSGSQRAFRPDDVLLGWMQRYKAPLLLNDPHHDPRFTAARWPASVRSLLSTPLMAQARLIGILTVFNKKGNAGFAANDRRLLTIIAAQSAQVVDNARMTEEHNRVLQIFGQHTSPTIVDELLRRGADTTSRRLRVCVMFLDLRDFTSFAEEHTPEEVVRYLNTLFDFMIAHVNRHRGIIHQLLGDGFMALFGAPLSHGNDAQHAVEAALAIIENIRGEVEAGTIPPTHVGIGLHAGEVVAGTVGSAIHKEYKVTGDAVNLAARIEQMTKQFDAQLLISEAVWKALEDGRFQAERLGPVEVRGRTAPVPLYRLA